MYYIMPSFTSHSSNIWHNGQFYHSFPAIYYIMTSFTILSSNILHNGQFYHSFPAIYYIIASFTILSSNILHNGQFYHSFQQFTTWWPVLPFVPAIYYIMASFTIFSSNIIHDGQFYQSFQQSMFASWLHILWTIWTPDLKVAHLAVNYDILTQADHNSNIPGSHLL